MAYGAVTVSAAGSGYVLGEFITLAGGTGSQPLRVMVTATTAWDGVSAGGVASAVLYDPGIFTTVPTGTLGQSATNKSGSGATFAAPGFTSILGATIQSVASSSSITLSTVATASQTGAARFVAYGHDDRPAFTEAVSALIAKSARGSRLYVPTPKGQGYLFGSSLILPGANAPPNVYRNPVLIEGDGVSSVIRAAAAMDAVIKKDSVYSSGFEVSRLHIDAAYMAVHGVSIVNGQNNKIDGNWILNAAPGGSNVKIGPGDSAGQNTVSNNNMANDGLVHPVAFPTFALDMEAPDSNISFNFGVTSTYCDFYDNGANNHYVTNHGYNLDIPGAYNMCAGGASTWIGNTGGGGPDGMLGAFYVTGYGAHLTGNHAQGAAIGYRIANGVQTAQVIGNWSDYVTTPVQQDGGPGVNTVVAFNTGGQPVYQNFNGGLFSGLGQLTAGGSGGPIGWLGNYGRIVGQGSFAVGDGVDDRWRKRCFLRSSGTNAWRGDSQVIECVMLGSGVSGTTKILAGGGMTVSGSNEISVYADIAVAGAVTVKLHAYCSTQDYGYWTVDFGIAGNKDASGVRFEGASGLTTTPPTWTTVRKSSGAADWTPAVVLDTTNGGAYLTGSGTCTGGKTIYWTADVRVVETGAAN